MEAMSRLPRTTRYGALALPLALCLAGIVATLPGNVSAQEICVGKVTATDAEADARYLWKLLHDRSFETLESEFRDRQQGYEHGTYSEEKLIYSFGAFDSPTHSITPLLEEWVNGHKESYAARVSLAFHQISVGRALRGGKASSQTSDEQFKAMKTSMREAESNLNSSFSLTQKPIVAYVLAIEVQRFIGTRKSLEAVYQRALKIDPASAYVRQSYLRAIDPRWHGTRADMIKALDGIADSDLPNDTKRFLKYEGFMSLAGAHLMLKQPDLAESAMQIAATQCVLADPWQSLANLYNESGQWEKELGALERYRAIKPDEAWAIRRQAYAHERLANWPLALSLYKEAAEKGDAYAQNAYGWQLYEGVHVPRDVEAAFKWFRMAADRGDENARVNLAQALREGAATP